MTGDSKESAGGRTIVRLDKKHNHNGRTVAVGEYPESPVSF